MGSPLQMVSKTENVQIEKMLASTGADINAACSSAAAIGTPKLRKHKQQAMHRPTIGLAGKPEPSRPASEPGAYQKRRSRNS
jgi:hypothetical protein